MSGSQVFFWLVIPLLIKTIFSTSGQYVEKNCQLKERFTTEEYSHSQKYEAYRNILAFMNGYSQFILFSYFIYFFGLSGGVVYFFLLGYIPSYIGHIALKISSEGDPFNWHELLTSFPRIISVVFTLFLIYNAFMFHEYGEPRFYFDINFNP